MSAIWSGPALPAPPVSDASAPPIRPPPPNADVSALRNERARDRRADVGHDGRHHARHALPQRLEGVAERRDHGAAGEQAVERRPESVADRAREPVDGLPDGVQRAQVWRVRGEERGVSAA